MLVSKYGLKLSFSLNCCYCINGAPSYNFWTSGVTTAASFLFDSNSLLISVSRLQITFVSRFIRWFMRSISVRKLKGTLNDFFWLIKFETFWILCVKFSSALSLLLSELFSLLSQLAGTFRFFLLRRIVFSKVFSASYVLISRQNVNFFVKFVSHPRIFWCLFLRSSVQNVCWR